MSKEFNVIWIDDEYDKMNQLQNECRVIHHINLMPFRTQRQGMAELEKNLDKYDAVLLDAKMFDETENELAQLTGLQKAINKICSLSSRKVVPYFISTGQPDLMSSELFEQSYGKPYIKGSDDLQLIQDMIAAMEHSQERQIDYRYSDVFKCVDTLHFDENARSILQRILLSLHYPSDHPLDKPELYYNQIRKLLEYVFRVFHSYGLLPDECLPGNNVNLNQCSQYIAGRDAIQVGVRYGQTGERIIPKWCEYTIRNILELGNIHSHTIESGSADSTAFSRYLVFGFTLELCEIIKWVSDYVSNHSNVEENRKKCVYLKIVTVMDEMSAYEGREFVPEKDENNVWHCAECKVAIQYWLSGKMRLKNIQKNTDPKTSERYPFFAGFDKIESNER